MILDDVNTYKSLDPSGMLSLLKGFPSQCRKAWGQAQDFNFPSDYRGVKKVVVAGVGGSAIAGDLVSSIVEPEGIPVNVYRDYTVPPILDSQSLFIASSHSGNTEETLSAFSLALKTSAKKIALTTGGRLAEEAQKNGVPIFKIFAQEYPPRYALGYSFLGILGLVQRACSLDLLKGKEEEAFKSLEIWSSKIAENVSSSRNPAKSLALKLKGKVIVVYGAGFTVSVARRWKSQFNENSKVWAFYEAFPELNHNSIEGYSLPLEARGDFFVLMLYSDRLHPRTQLRYKITEVLLKGSDIPYEILQAEGSTPLSQMLNLICLGDYASYYLALLNGKDPAPVENVNFLKKRLT